MYEIKGKIVFDPIDKTKKHAKQSSWKKNVMVEFKDDTWDFFPEYSFLNEVVNPSALNCTSK